MAKKPETTFKERVIKDLTHVKHSGGRVEWCKIDSKCKVGEPDLFLSLNGQAWVMELKTDLKGSRLAPIQRARLRSFEASRAIASVETPSSWPETLSRIKVAAFDFGAN